MVDILTAVTYNKPESNNLKSKLALGSLGNHTYHVMMRDAALEFKASS